MLSTDTEHWVSSSWDSQTPQRSSAQPLFLPAYFFCSNLRTRHPHPKHCFEGWDKRKPLLSSISNSSGDAQWSMGNTHETWIFKKCLGAACLPVEDTAVSLQGPWQAAQRQALPCPASLQTPKPVFTHRLSSMDYTWTRAPNSTTPVLLPVHTDGILLSTSDTGPY